MSAMPTITAAPISTTNFSIIYIYLLSSSVLDIFWATLAQKLQDLCLTFLPSWSIPVGTLAARTKSDDGLSGYPDMSTSLTF